jgi:hypothetical protein
MDVESALVRNLSPKEQLVALEKEIREALADGRQAIRQIGSDLTVIRDNNLWQVANNQYRDFWQYSYDAFGLEARGVKYAMNAASAFRVLEQAHLQLPVNDSQAYELSKLDQEHQAIVWRRVLETCAEKNLGITVLRIREAVLQEKEDLKKGGATAKRIRKPKKEVPKPEATGVQIDMGSDEEQELLLTERGEEALARVQALCGEVVAAAIRAKKNDKVTEDALCKWADQEPETIRELPRYVYDRGWSVRKSLNYISQIIEGDTEVDELVLMARNRGGRFVGVHLDARIVVEIMLKK